MFHKSLYLIVYKQKNNKRSGNSRLNNILDEILSLAFDWKQIFFLPYVIWSHVFDLIPEARRFID